MRILGIDPDLHHAGIAFVDTTAGPILGIARSTASAKPVIRAVRCPLATGRGYEAVVKMALAMQVALEELFQDWGEPDVAVVEGQESYLGSRVRPQDLIHLATASGIAVGLVRAYYGRPRIEVPQPKNWKGSVPKAIHQKRILKAVGIPFEQGSVPPRILRLPANVGFEGIAKSNLSHVIDAIGLTLWGSAL